MNEKELNRIIKALFVTAVIIAITYIYLMYKFLTNLN